MVEVLDALAMPDESCFAVGPDVPQGEAVLFQGEVVVDVSEDFDEPALCPVGVGVFDDEQAADKGFFLEPECLVEYPCVLLDVPEASEEASIYIVPRDFKVAFEHSGSFIEELFILAAARLVEDHPKHFDGVTGVDHVPVLVVGA